MAKILIVEDNQGTNKAICEYMKEAGHTLFSAFTGSEALKIFRGEELDIIVLDIMLPEMSGIVVLHEISVLPSEQLQHIFEPFYRPDLAHSQATGGNGLGLYIVQTILDKLRLKYQFVPMPNDRGMSFTIQF